MSKQEIIGIFQIVVSFLLIIAILLQQRGAGLGVFGGGRAEFYHRRRGLEKLIFRGTIALAVIFFVLGILAFLMK